MGAQGLCTSAETSGYRLAVVFAGRSALASVSLLGATSVVRLETCTYVLPTGFYIVQVRCPLGHLIDHLGGKQNIIYSFDRLMGVESGDVRPTGS